MNEDRKMEEWIAILGERPLSEQETEAFRERLRESPDALDEYLDHCDIETWLTAAGDSLVQSDPAIVEQRTDGEHSTSRSSQRR